MIAEMIGIGSTVVAVVVTGSMAMSMELSCKVGIAGILGMAAGQIEIGLMAIAMAGQIGKGATVVLGSTFNQWC